MLRRRRLRALSGIAAATAVMLSVPLGFGPVAAADEPGYYSEIEAGKLSAVYTDSFEVKAVYSRYDSGPADRATDGNFSTFWLSNAGGGKGPTEAPHTLIVGTSDNSVIDQAARVTVTFPARLKYAGHIKDLDLFARADGVCDNSEDGWAKVASASAEADDTSPMKLTFDPQPANCFKLVANGGWDLTKSGWQESSMTSVAEVSVATWKEGEAPAFQPEGTAYRDRPLADGATPTSQYLDQYALDDRVADNPDRTPIALRIPSWDGQERIVGARPNPNPGVAQDESHAYYVDCQADPAGAAGTKEHPWTSVEDVNSHGDFAPGESILFKRGTRCVGLLHPHGSGVEGQRITLDAYGDLDQPKPLIEAMGQKIAPGDDLPQQLATQEETGVDSAALRLYNQEYWTIRNLALTNYSGDDQDYQVRRRGLLVTLDNYGSGYGYDISGMEIHDVLGHTKKDIEGSAGIQFEVYGTEDGTPSDFNDVEIHHNEIRHVNRSGINMGTSYRKRPSVGPAVNSGPALQYHGWGPMDIHDNLVHDIGGDGIVTQYANGTRNYNNTVWFTSNHHNGRSYSGNNAAIWPWNADNVSYVNNHVFDTMMPAGTWDGTAFDSDYGQTGTLVEYNVTHDNEGGFMLFCGYAGNSSKAVARYNLSINDGHGAEKHSYGSRAWALLGETDGAMYNNTFVLYPNAWLGRATQGNYRDNITYTNNVFFSQGEIKTSWESPTVDARGTDKTPFDLTPIVPLRNNLYAGPATAWPMPDKNLVHPEVTAAGSGLDAVKPPSAIAREAGLRVLDADAQDLGGAAVPALSTPDLGAFQLGSAVAAPLLVNGGFEDGLDSWPFDPAVNENGPARSGKHGLELNGGYATQTFSAGVNLVHRVVAAVKPAEDGTLPVVTLRNPAGLEATPVYGTPDADGWVPVHAYMRTAWDATELTVVLRGEGTVDDVTVTPVRDYMVDGSFQARGNTERNFENTLWTLAYNEHTDDAVSGGRAAALDSRTTRTDEVLLPADGTYELAGWVKADAGVSSALTGLNGWNVALSADGSGAYTQLVGSDRAAAGRVSVECGTTGDGVTLCDDVIVVAAFDGSVPRVDGEATVVPPSAAPSEAPTEEPTAAATEAPTQAPSAAATEAPSAQASAEASAAASPASSASASASAAPTVKVKSSLARTGASIAVGVLAVGLLIAGVGVLARGRRRDNSSADVA